MGRIAVLTTNPLTFRIFKKFMKSIGCWEKLLNAKELSEEELYDRATSRDQLFYRLVDEDMSWVCSTEGWEFWAITQFKFIEFLFDKDLLEARVKMEVYDFLMTFVGSYGSKKYSDLIKNFTLKYDRKKIADNR